MEVSYFARTIYEIETVTSGLCYIEDLTFLENNIVWFWNSLDVQSNDISVELYNLHSYSSIGCLYYLSVHYCCFYIQYHGGIREIASITLHIFSFTLCSVFLTRWRNIRPFYITFVLTIQKGPDLNLSPQFTICSYTHLWYWFVFYLYYD